MLNLSRRVVTQTTLVPLLLLAACESPSTTSRLTAPLTDDVARSVSASGSAVTMTVGDTTTLVQFSPFAQQRLAWGDVLTWVSKSPAVLSVTQSGLATAKVAGSSLVIVNFKAKVDTLAVTVTAAQVATISASAPSTTIVEGQTSQLTVVAEDASGQVIPAPPLVFSSSSTGTLTVNATGMVTAVVAGSATVTVQSGGVSASVNFVVSAAPNAPAPPPPSGTPIAVPQAPQSLSFTYPQVTGRSWILSPTDNLQNALNSAQRGDEIVLSAGATYTGNFVLPNKSGTAANGWVLIRSNRTLPAVGTRVTPAHASLMPRIVTPNVQPAIATSGAASGWWISGIEITIVPVLSYINYGLVALGDGSNKQNTLSKVPSDLVIERSYVHGQPTTKTSRCIALNSARTAIMDSYVHECHLKGFDSQAILGWNGPGPFKIHNNTLAGAGENILFGGADPSIPNLIPSDIEITRNYIVTPVAWKGVWTKKNLFELKSAKRVLLQGNVFDGSWVDGQTGFAVVLKVSNQSGGCTWCETTDVTFRQNIFRNIGAGFSIQGLQGGSAHPVGGLLSRVAIEDNLVENVNVGQFAGEARIISVMNNVQSLAIRRNTLTTTGKLMQFLNLASNPAGTDFVFERNVATYGNYGFFSSWYGIGESSMKGFKGVKSFANIVMIGATKAGYPNGTFVPSLSAATSTGMGVNPTLISTATAGVVIP